MTFSKSYTTLDLGFNKKNINFRKVFGPFIAACVLILIGQLSYTIALNFKEKKYKLDLLIIKDKIHLAENSILLF